MEKHFFLKNKGEDGFIIEMEELAYWCELSGYAYVNFNSYDDFLNLMDVNTELHFFYCENCGLASFLRNDERGFYHVLKQLENFVDQCDVFGISYKDEVVLFEFFEGINNFMREYKKGFQHNNKKLENRFNKIAKKLERVTGLPSWLKY